MLKRRLNRAVVFACAAILAAGAAGAGNTAFGAPSYRASSNKEEVKGRILVSGGPDISISYDKDGTVLEIKGIDRDGKNFLEGQDGYVGKSCKTAVGRLVRRLDEKGWFDEHADGSRKSLVVKAEKGSEYPDDQFMREIEDEVRDIAKDREINVYIKVVGTHSLDGKGYIDRETAEKIVLEQFGLKEDSLKFKEYELDDGVYEIEVVIQGVGHEVELDAVTGAVLDIDRDDDHDGRYDDDDRDDDHDDDRDDDHDDDRYDDHDDDRDDDHDDDDDRDHDDDNDNDRDDD
ncbi:PepSY domain-containing protein [Enterocloster aldenensis]|uniref:PepSY domain-containing protein n=1 Tax=Enterocloster aldenensis TaxID=358742 RepID=A0AAW5C2L4_9FIRM|nr:PepSY domain-containing protein [Enterocloster aldenensis]